MARKQASDNQPEDQKTVASGEVENTPSVQADHDSVALGSLHVDGNVDAPVVLGRDNVVTIGFTAEQASAFMEKVRSDFQPKPFDGTCPYKGLDAFTEDDVELFFGRENMVKDLVNRIQEARAVFVTGSSGSGKSSLVRAGLIPALKKAEFSKHWLYAILTPERDPFESLARAFSRLKDPSLGKYFRENNKQVSVLNDCAESALSDRQNQRLMIFIDQFEEVFTQLSRDKTQTFISLINHAATVENGRVILLFSLRSDFLSTCQTYPQLNVLLGQKYAFAPIGAMQAEELASAIAQPALRIGLKIDPTLVAQIINDMRGEPGALPLMQFALKDLFDSQQAKGSVIALTLEDYLQHGGIHKSLERHADNSFARLSEDEQQLASSIFSRLIEIGRGTSDTRRTTLLDELVPVNTSTEDVHAVIQKLADARLIITDEQAGKDTVTISHEKLIDAWPWLKKLVNENRDAIALQNEIASDAKEWEDHQRDESYLYTGARLASAREQMEEKKIQLGNLAQTFVNAGIEAVEAERQDEERRRQKELEDTRRFAESEARRAEIEEQRAREQTRSAANLRKRSLYLSVALGLAMLAIGFAVWFGLQSRHQANIALARQLAAQAQFINSTRDVNQTVGVLLAIKSMQMFPSSEAAQVLQDNLLARPVTHFEHEGNVLTVMFSPNGKLILSGSDDNTARIWDSSTGREIMKFSHDGPVTSAAFSSNGEWVVTGSDDHNVRVWNVETGNEIVRITHGDVVNSVAFSPNQKWVLSAGDRTIRVSDARTGREIARMIHDDIVNAAAFSPDGKRVVSGSADKTARVWDIVAKQEVSRMLHNGNVLAVAFSPDGTRVVSGSEDSTARVWDATTGSEIARTDNGTEIYAVAFSPDGSQIISGGSDRMATVWDANTGKTISHILTNYRVLTVGFSPDGRYVASGGDITARVWDPQTGREIARMTHDSSVNSIAFSPDGKWVVSGSNDFSARVWEITNQQNVAMLQHDDDVKVVAISPDSKLVASGGWDNTFRVWKIETEQELFRVTYQEDRYLGLVRDISFSPDSKRVVVADRDKTARVLDILSGKEVARMTHDGQVYSVAFSPDGSKIVSGSEDGTARVWDAMTGEEIARMTHDDLVLSVIFSPNGQLVASGSYDNTARVWDAITGEEISRFNHKNHVNAVAFSFDNEWVVSGSDDNTASVWDVKTGKMISQITFNDDVVYLAFSPDKKYVVSDGSDTSAFVWNASTGLEVAHMAHDNSILSVAFSPDGNWVASAGWDNTARVWNALTGKEVARMTHGDAVRSVKFSSDGKWIISGGKDNTVRIWLWRPEDLIANACGRLQRNLTRDEWHQFLDNETYQPICPNLPIDMIASPVPASPSLPPLPNPIPVSTSAP